MEITEQQKQEYLNDINEVDKKHGLQLVAVLHRIETDQKSSSESMMGIRELPKPVEKEEEVKEETEVVEEEVK